ncbi:unnamed protein product [Chironomus riparius]|uniref:F-box domain-containing protein n=1 Tax=Chironomus riparius TaxID=315576 RepID=A0A9N9RK70_9DIPT|nr:unnamed protein product [Chironomus riparius]
MSWINCLPDYVMVEIFENMTPKMIKSCCLFCKRWDDIISTSKQLMGKYRLSFNTSFDYKKSMHLKRKYQDVNIKMLFLPSLKAIIRHNIHTLELSSRPILKLSIFIQLLNSIPLLKVLKVDFETFIYDIQNIEESMKVSTNLEEVRCVAEICHIFGCSTIKVLDLFWKETINYKGRLLIFEYLNKQKHLEDFKLNEHANGEFFRYQASNAQMFAFCLKIFVYYTSRFDKYQQLINFLELHKNL